MNANEPTPNPAQSEKTSKSLKTVGGVLAAGAVAFGGNAVASGMDQSETSKTVEPPEAVAEAPADTQPSLNTDPAETTVTVSAPEATVAPVESQPVDEAPVQESVVSAPVTDAPAPSAPENSPVSEEMPVLIGGQVIEKNEDGTVNHTVFPITSSTGEVVQPTPAPVTETPQTPPQP